MNKKTLALLLSVVLVIGVVAGSSLAWLTDKTSEVKNVFTTSDISVTLQEHKYDPEKDALTDEKTTTGVSNYKMIPGWTIPKDPWLTVKGGSEDCWLFIEVKEEGGDVTVGTTTYSFDDFIAYKIDQLNWTPLKDGSNKVVEGVYYCDEKDIKDDRVIQILDEGTYTFDGVDYNWNKQHVLTKPEVTKEMMNAVKEAGKEPTLTFVAYASQYWETNTESFSAYEAWLNIHPAS